MGKHDINAFLGAGTSFVGRLAFEGVVRIDGAFEGEIVSSGTLIVGKGARVAGRVEVGRLVCGGEVAAEVTATVLVAVHATGRMAGTVRTPAMSLEEGGRIEGEVAMGEANDIRPDQGNGPAALCGDEVAPQGV
ncbi:protein of unknown function DUF583 [Solidesulfovibrio fructosivorans JJ]]|uniref:Polymer-forming cytoskeletal protein n=1 Tax=Solidesulfovibrio fructosivorans JJ] TaxID=596151 RepID=E1JRU2_SOLFR|nr:polymer-forming cytoskeletal protein [Solidesulfovibrio fructosivorans]EFL52711.1 protein of unknown function DUF583 [Solidesulfovibrio fructosivorans JJ]]